MQPATPLRIAQVAPLTEAVPPLLYGGTERIVSYLTEELVRDGHDVTLFASSDSQTAARLVSCCDQALRPNPKGRDPLVYHLLMMERVRKCCDEFDIVHFHTDLLQFPLMHRQAHKTVTTLHGRLDLPDLETFFSAFPDVPLVSISDHQRRPMPPVNWAGTVLHGLPLDLLPFAPKAESRYLAFLGRIAPEKGADKAIEIAAAAGVPLKIAAKVGDDDKAYWDEVVKPLVDASPHVEFIGEINEREKGQFLGPALALLFPIDWPEPFGLVAIEAMACGTPVIAMRRGSMCEVIDDGVSGFLVDTVEAAVAAVERIDTLDRAAVRACFERRFSVERMARDYVGIYRKLIAEGPRHTRPPSMDRGLEALDELV